MKLDSISLKNFRCYKSISLTLHPKVTVLVANNGQGKTALLDAIRIGLWPYVSSFDLAKTATADPANTITVADTLMLKADKNMVRQLPSEVILIGNYGDGTKTWMRFRDSEARKSQTKDDSQTRELKNFAVGLQKSIRDVNAKPKSLPIFGFYGTGRLWNEKRLTESKKGSSNRKGDERIRTFAYRDCLDPASSYKQFEEWFALAFKEIREGQIRQLESGASSLASDPAIENPVTVIQRAVNELLKDTGWHNLSYSETHDQSLVLHHPEKGTLKVDQLSDGIKNMLAMVADIAYRCALLNAHLGAEAALESEGLVMIDEVDMHLHPQWQQTVVSGLTKAFPNIQFVITTHSPQVLSTVSAERIRIITHEKDPETGLMISSARVPDKQSRGVASADVMAELQGVDPVPSVEEAHWLTQYKQLITQGDQGSNDGQRLKNKILDHFGENHQEWLECERLIRLQSMKSKLPKRNR
ncbi:MAG: AAA family ATPase [Candidatus Azotimanducaceae bacterium WSBS_2022_MAG_OTU7]